MQIFDIDYLIAIYFVNYFVFELLILYRSSLALEFFKLLHAPITLTFRQHFGQITNVP